jgi:hypothetical protein
LPEPIPPGPPPSGQSAGPSSSAATQPAGTPRAGTQPAGTQPAATSPAATSPAGTPPAGTPSAGTPPANGNVNGGPSDVEPAGFTTRPVLFTTAICAAAAALGHGVLWLAAGQHWIDKGVFWQPVVGISMSIVSITAFGGFLVASRRTRVAIAACFLLTFLVSLTYLLTIQDLADKASRGLAKDAFNDFRTVVVTIIGFYFGSEAIVAAAKIVGSARRTESGASAAEIRRMDRDLPTTKAPAS